MAQAKAKRIGKQQAKVAQTVTAKLPHKVTDYTLKFMALSVPVVLYTAAREEKIELHQYHTKCHNPIKQLGNFCPVCAGLPKDSGPDALDPGSTLEEVRLQKDDIYKGFDCKDKIVPITDEDIEAAKPDSGKVLEILEFVNGDEVDPISFDSSFYLAPNTSAGEAALRIYGVIRKAMEVDNKFAVARIIKARHEYIAFITTYGDKGLILYTSFMADEVRQMAFPDLPDANPGEVKAARGLIEEMTNEWNPTKYTDTYRSNINALIEAKRDGVEAPKIERKPVASVGGDLMASLTASLEIAKAQKKGKKTA